MYCNMSRALVSVYYKPDDEECWHYYYPSIEAARIVIKRFIDGKWVVVRRIYDEDDEFMDGYGQCVLVDQFVQDTR